MYIINNLNIGRQIQYYRKTRGYTLEQLGLQISKTKATISKYEKNEIIPDIITIIEICNVLDINISELIPVDIKNTSINNFNPFSCNKLYLYYYTDNMLITSVLDIFMEKHSLNVKLYNGIKNIQNYATEYSYYYEGFLETDRTIAYITLKNVISQNIILEKLQISINIPWSNNFQICNCFISALTPNSLPVVKKGIISKNEITNFENYADDLKPTKIEIEKIYRNNSWILESSNYDHFFFKTQ